VLLLLLRSRVDSPPPPPPGGGGGGGVVDPGVDFGVYDEDGPFPVYSAPAGITRLSVQAKSLEYRFTFPYQPLTREIAWLLDSLSSPYGLVRSDPVFQRSARITWAELYVDAYTAPPPAPSRKGVVGWAEVTVAGATQRRALVSWAEFSVGVAAANRKGRVAWSEVSVP
jgi:hypothetical protein